MEMATNGQAVNGVSKKVNGATNGVHVGNGTANGTNGVHVGNGTSNGTNGAVHDNKVFDNKAQQFLDCISDLVREKVLPGYEDRDEKVVEFKHPTELEALFDLQVRKEPVDLDTLMLQAKQVVKYSVKTGHARFMNQLFAGVDPYSLAGTWLSAALNTSGYTFEVAPVFAVMEKYLMEKLCGFIGFPDGDGLFCPGGSMCNFFAVHVARYQKNPQVKVEGHASQQRMVMFTSEDSHYSMKKAASFLGIGMNNLVQVKVDDRGRMDPKHLEECVCKAKEEGAQPFFVNCTAGTTVLGAYDPLPEVAEVCARHHLWMHVDATWGGACLLTPTHRQLAAGIDKADSVSWNLHKMMGAHLQCSALLLKEKGLLEVANSAKADYLFQTDKYYDASYDVGDKSMQCGRMIDSLKLWFMWRAHGDDAIGARINNAYDNARYLEKKMVGRSGFRKVMPEFQCTNVCFWFIPPSLRDQPETTEWKEALGKVAPAIKGRMVANGTLMIGYQPLVRAGHPNFFRFVTSNIASNHGDMDFVLDEIERLGADL